MIKIFGVQFRSEREVKEIMFDAYRDQVSMDLKNQKENVENYVEFRKTLQEKNAQIQELKITNDGLSLIAKENETLIALLNAIVDKQKNNEK